MVLIWNPHVSGLYAKRTWMKYYFLYVIKRNEGNSILVPWWVKGDTIWVFQVMLLTLLRLFYPAAAKSLQLCPTLCDPIDGSPPGSTVPGILQARTLEWVTISFSNAWKWKVKVKSLSRVRLLATPWTVAYQAPPSMGFSRQEYWSGVPSPSPLFGCINICNHFIFLIIYHFIIIRFLKNLCHIPCLDFFV